MPPAKQVHMEMLDRLPAVLTRIDHQPIPTATITGRNLLLSGDLRRSGQQMPQ